MSLVSKARPASFSNAVYGHGRFLLYPILQILTLYTFLHGGVWLWTGTSVIAAATLGLDEVSGDDRGLVRSPRRFILDLVLYLALPLQAVLTLFLIYYVADVDAFGLERLTRWLFGIDLRAAREGTGALGIAGAILTVGIHFSMAAGNVGHELIHRTTGRWARIYSRWLFAFCLDTNFTIEHVYGHHRTVGTAEDPTTAMRGMSFWRFFPRSVLLGNRNAFRFEAARLRGKRRHWLSLQNQAISGQIMSLTIVLIAYWGAGAKGMMVFLAAACIGKLMIEQFNYVGHYGLVRVPGAPIEPRHSWNSYHALSTSFMFNLPRHAHHHVAAGKPYWELERKADSPETPYGAFTMIMIALFPPLWHRVMAPKLADWDRRLASADERALLESGYQ